MKIKLDTITSDSLPFWQLKPGNVEAIAASMRETGLLNPITVRPSQGDEEYGYVVIAGRHRVEAALSLGWDSIEANVIKDMSPDQYRLATADENLCRASLSPAETAAWTAWRKQAYEALHPDTKAGVAGGKARHGKSDADPAFVEDTAKASGKSKSKVFLDAKRGKAIAAEVLAEVQGTDLDKGVVLDELAATPKPEQKEKLKEIKARPKTPKTKPVSIGKGGMPRAKADAADLDAFNNACSHYLGMADAPIRFEFWNYILLCEKERGAMLADIWKPLAGWITESLKKSKEAPKAEAKPKAEKKVAPKPAPKGKVAAPAKPKAAKSAQASPPV